MATPRNPAHAAKAGWSQANVSWIRQASEIPYSFNFWIDEYIAQRNEFHPLRKHEEEIQELCYGVDHAAFSRNVSTLLLNRALRYIDGKPVPVADKTRKRVRKQLQQAVSEDVDAHSVAARVLVSAMNTALAYGTTWNELVTILALAREPHTATVTVAP
jgi:hypothetical protein